MAASSLLKGMVAQVLIATCLRNQLIRDAKPRPIASDGPSLWTPIYTMAEPRGATIVAPDPREFPLHQGGLIFLGMASHLGSLPIISSLFHISYWGTKAAAPSFMEFSTICIHLAEESFSSLQEQLLRLVWQIAQFLGLKSAQGWTRSVPYVLAIGYVHLWFRIRAFAVELAVGRGMPMWTRRVSWCCCCSRLSWSQSSLPCPTSWAPMSHSGTPRCT